MDTNPISVIFVTHNRKGLLCQAINAVLQQTVPVQVIVMDDASTDGTEAVVKASFPEVSYYRTEQNLGPAYQRNEGAKKANSDILIFLDDDTLVQAEDTIAKTIADFDKQYIGAVAMPFINILQDKKVQTGSPDSDQAYFYHSFIAAAFAFRRNLFLELGGFRTEYFYMGEEGDLSIRLLEKGYYVKAGTAQPSLHYQPAGRVCFRADFYGRRNDILFAYFNAPRIYLLPNLVSTVIKGLWFGLRVKRIGNMMKGITAGIKLLFSVTAKSKVSPVSAKVFLQFRHLKKNEPLPANKLVIETSTSYRKKTLLSERPEVLVRSV